MNSIFQITGRSIVQALQELRVNKLRTFLSLLGITIGIFCIIAVLTVLDSMKNNIQKDMDTLGSDVLYVGRWPWMDEGGEYKWWEYWRRPSMTPSDMKASESPNHRSVVDVRAVAHDGSIVNVAGALSGPQLVEKIVQINGRNFDLRAQGTNLVINYVDEPGALGKIGTLLGAARVNIQAAQLSEDAEGPGATILLRLDQDVPGDVRSAIASAVGANKLEVVDLS
jgi:ABC-type antimicrobial peptide transport system permease subunit